MYLDDKPWICKGGGGEETNILAMRQSQTTEIMIA